jgi:hypothetical protein
VTLYLQEDASMPVVTILTVRLEAAEVMLDIVGSIGAAADACGALNPT